MEEKHISGNDPALLIEHHRHASYGKIVLFSELIACAGMGQSFMNGDWNSRFQISDSIF
jgi:hypothetical protein